MLVFTIYTDNQHGENGRTPAKSSMTSTKNNDVTIKILHRRKSGDAAKPQYGFSIVTSFLSLILLRLPRTELTD
jgi:hypothetical protein